MFCPECGSEYRDDFTECSDCGVALVETLEPPEQPLSDGVLVPLTETRNFFLVDAIVERLEKAGVPYVITAGTGLPLLDHPDVPLEEPEPWEARILVHAELYERARRIFQEIKPTAP